MEAEWQADRSSLRELMHSRPELSLKQMAEQLKRSYAWAKKWAKRFLSAPVDDVEILHSRSRARQTPFPGWHPQVWRCVEQIRQIPPDGLPFPVQTLAFIVVQETLGPQLFEDTSRCPLLKAPMGTTP